MNGCDGDAPEGVPVPFYDDGMSCIYHRSALSCPQVWLGADVLITDPPYGRNWRQGTMRHGTRGGDDHHGIAGDQSTEVRDRVLELWGDRRAVVFGDLMLPPPAGTKQVLIYRKPPNSGWRGSFAGFRRDCEAIYLVGAWKAGFGCRSSVVMTAEPSVGGPASPQAKFGHPHVKPADVMDMLVGLCEPGDVVADPFAGSGSTLVSAKALGHRSVGCEVEVSYCRTAERRLAQNVLDIG